MKVFKILSIVFTMMFVLGLTLPAFADTGPPAPKTEKKGTFEVMNQLKDAVAQITGINSEASPDIGQVSVVYTTEKSNDHFDLEKADPVFYLSTPERLCPALYGYVAKRPCKMLLNRIRPPVIHKE